MYYEALARLMKIRPFQTSDRRAMLNLWHQGWHDAHAHLVPVTILEYRTLPYFSVWMDECPDDFFVLHEEEQIVGFVSLSGSEIVKLYVGREFRGKNAAWLLMEFAEATLASNGITVAELFCTEGNTRAERFYVRRGWRLSRIFDDCLWLPNSAFKKNQIVRTQHFIKTISL